MGLMVTVVIPTRNRLCLLREAIESAERAGALTIVVDDASEDKTAAWLAASSSPMLTVISLADHRERSVARNRGLDMVSTPFVLFLDDDDRLRAPALAALERALVARPDSFAAVGGFEYFDGSGHTKVGAHPDRFLVRDTWMEAVFGWVPLTGRTLFRAEAVRRVGGFPVGLSVGEDRELWLRLARSAPVVLVPDVVLEHRLHPGQLRPADARNLEASITKRHLETLLEPELGLGARIHRGREAFEGGLAQWKNGHPRSAMRSFAAMWRLPLPLLLSPLVRRLWLSVIVRTSIAAVLGDRGLRRIRGLLSLLRKVRGVDAWKPPYPREPERDIG